MNAINGLTKRHISTHRIVCWQLTRRCNRRCVFCTTRSSPSEPHPNRDPFPVLERLNDLGVEKLSYSGGEVLMYPQFERLVRKANNVGFRQILTSNGDILMRRIPQFLEMMEYVKVSFYGSEQQHDAVMGPGHYRRLLEVCAEMTSHCINVGANYMLSSKSLSSAQCFLQDAASAGVRQVLFLTYMPTGTEVVDGSYSLSSRNGGFDPVSFCDEIVAVSRSFRGGVKVHDYSHQDFFLVVNERDDFILPRYNGLPDFVMGSVFTDALHLPNGSSIPTRRALEAIWRTRLTTPAILPVNT